MARILKEYEHEHEDRDDRKLDADGLYMCVCVGLDADVYMFGFNSDLYVAGGAQTSTKSGRDFATHSVLLIKVTITRVYLYEDWMRGDVHTYGFYWLWGED
uniref:Uncharacterized protein n=1 Tax=Psilocybe cubensis TaxID=181762 RepID=A0A8H7XSM5_PSICU